MDKTSELAHFRRVLSWMELNHKEEQERFRGLRPEHVTREDFFRTHVWVVLVAGFRYSILDALRP